ncbi:unnamed protein product [Clonostachys rosea]|uniref:Uncharacterized protein n=1 Tax=Bionectria ochroleuca TaxID=29856 RepID=A0ABY6UIX8_BIOOC|nr:unnamed protein product [Clonostachys rosea]
MNFTREVAEVLDKLGIQLSKEQSKEVATDTLSTEPNEGYPDQPIALVYRSYKYAPQQPRFTLLIRAIWTSSSAETWEDAVRAIKLLTDHHLRAQALDVEAVDVEMIATQIVSQLNPGLDLERSVSKENYERMCDEIEEAWDSNSATEQFWLTFITPPERDGRYEMKEKDFVLYFSNDLKAALLPPIAAKFREILAPFGLHLDLMPSHWELFGCHGTKVEIL